MEKLWKVRIILGCSAILLAVWLGMYFAPSVLAAPEGSYNVKQYRAYGNGISNDTAGIQAAIDAAAAAGGGMVYFPNGTYIVRDTIWLADNVKLYAETSVVIQPQMTGQTAVFAADMVNGIEISGLRMQCDNHQLIILEARQSDDVKLRDMTGTGGMLLSATDSTHWTLDGCHMAGLSMAAACEFRNSDCVQFVNCHFADYAVGISAENCEEFAVSQTIFNNCGMTFRNAGKIRVSKCVIQKADRAIWVQDGRDIQIFGNELACATDCAIWLDSCQIAQVQANGIYTDIDGGLLLRASGEDVSVIGNQIAHEIGADGVSAGSGLGKLEFFQVRNLLLQGNIWNNVAVEIEAGATETVVSGNQLLNENYASAAVCALALQLTQPGGRATVCNNLIRTQTELPEGSNALQITLAGGETATIENNDFLGFQTDLKLYCAVPASGQVQQIFIVGNMFRGEHIDCPEWIAQRAVIQFLKNRDAAGKPLELNQANSPAIKTGTRFYQQYPQTHAGSVYTSEGWRQYGELSDGIEPVTVSRNGNRVCAAANGKYLDAGNILILAVYDPAGDLQSVAMTQPWMAGDLYVESDLMVIADTGGWAKAFVWENAVSMRPLEKRTRYFTQEDLQ